MLEKIDFSVPKVTKAEYKPLHDSLVEKLVVLQQEARARNIGLVVLFEGWNGAGKGGRISDLLYELDARATSVHVTENFNVDDARLFRENGLGATGYYPPLQEFWKALGPRGNITFFDRGWYTSAAQRLMYARPSKDLSPKRRKKLEKSARAAAETCLGSIENFESQLVDDGYIVIKFFLHIRESVQRERLEGLAGDPATAWRVSKRELKHLDDYEQTYRIYDRFLHATNYSFAPWVVLNGEDKRRANLAVVRTIVEKLEAALHQQVDPEQAAAAQAALANSAGGTLVEGDERSRTLEENRRLRVEAEAEAAAQHAFAPAASMFDIVTDFPTLTGVDRHLRLEREDYKRRLKEEQARMFELELQMYQKRIPLMVLFEGWDAAGKGGAIKRVAQALDARAYTIFPSPAPTKEELLHPHLWRYWTRLPKAGHVGIYDRTWYGRVLVERIEGFASPAEWARAYDEINEFEKDLVDWGAILLKFWVDVSPEEQLARFEARENDPSKQWKITAEDWRNRDKFPQYKSAVEDMFRLTSTEHAPWTILESDDKLYARVKALRLINEALEERLR